MTISQATRSTPVDSNANDPVVTDYVPVTLLPVTVITPPGRWAAIDLGEVWQYRDLLYQMALRDISARYRQSMIGIGWAVIRPIMTMLVFTFVFGRVAKLGPDGIPYALFSFAAIIPWSLFAHCLGQSSQSLVASSSLITKVYFPRLLLPLNAIAVGLVDFFIQVIVFLVLAFGFYLSGSFLPVLDWRLMLLPIFVLLCVLSGLGIGLWLTALNVKYRDVTHAVPFLTQIWMWMSPVAYPASVVPEQWRWLYGLNPMCGVIEAFRWIVLGMDSPSWSLISISSLMVLAMLVGGLIYFSKTERHFADII